MSTSDGALVVCGIAGSLRQGSYNRALQFDEQGRLTDEKTREFVGKLLRELADWTQGLGREPEVERQ